MSAEPSTPQVDVVWWDGQPAESLVVDLACDGDVLATELAIQKRKPDHEAWREIVLLRRLS